jgi:hypothetical protein
MILHSYINAYAVEEPYRHQVALVAWEFPVLAHDTCYTIVGYSQFIFSSSVSWWREKL